MFLCTFTQVSGWVYAHMCVCVFGNEMCHTQEAELFFWLQFTWPWRKLMAAALNGSRRFKANPVSNGKELFAFLVTVNTLIDPVPYGWQKGVI